MMEQEKGKKKEQNAGTRGHVLVRPQQERVLSQAGVRYCGHDRPVFGGMCRGKRVVDIAVSLLPPWEDEFSQDPGFPTD